MGDHNGQTGTGWLDPATAKDYNGVAPAGTTTYLDALERPIAMKDPLFGASGVPGIACSKTLTGNYTSCTNYNVGQVSGDNNYYIVTNNVDPNAHVQKSYDDTLGRAIYSLAYSGLYGHSPTANEQTTVQYNVLDEPTQVTETDLAPQSGQSITSVTATATYDSMGRVTQESDPDSGTHTYTYDANGQVLTDVSGTRTLGSNYDLLGRLGCLQDAAPTVNATGACTSGTHPYEQDTYDVSAPGAQWGSTDYPVGRLTQSIATTYYPNGDVFITTQNTQYDQRGRAITDQLKLTLPSSWNVTTALPTYQMASSYNDANQLTTVTTSTVAANGNSTPGYTMTQVYDSTTGLLVGLGNTSSQVANLASVLYNENALVSSINFATNTGSATVASEQFSYDGDLRPIETNATWQSGSGTTGTILDQQRSYDPASNVISLSTTLAGVPGKSGSGGSETQNFCYDEQDRLVWAGNSGTQPAAGNGTCGSGTLSSNLSGAAYSNSFVYTHLGQLWQGPLNGGSTQYQYLYCNSNAPHQLNGMYPMGTTCSNLSGAVYKTSYDTWGNATSRTYNGTSTTQSFDLLDQLVKWNSGSTQKQWYAYNTSGERVLLRSTNSSATT
jgi:YD repeat-containing protein